MTSLLPSRVAVWVSAAKKMKPQVHRITPDRVDIYVQSAPEFFNGVVLDHLALRHAQCGFHAPEHADWVYPALCLKGGVQPNPDRMTPLNSLVLKSPVDLVPSCEQIMEEYEWRQELAKACSEVPIVTYSSEQLHEQYVKRACEQVIDHIKMLSIWAEAGRPREQQDCFTGMSRKEVKKVLGFQRLNGLDAKEKLDLFKRYHAPTFMVERLEASQAREMAVYDLLNDSMRYC